MAFNSDMCEVLHFGKSNKSIPFTVCGALRSHIRSKSAEAEYEDSVGLQNLVHGKKPFLNLKVTVLSKKRGCPE